MRSANVPEEREFTRFVKEMEPRLSYALAAAYGIESDVVEAPVEYEATSRWYRSPNGISTTSAAISVNRRSRDARSGLSGA